MGCISIFMPACSGHGHRWPCVVMSVHECPCAVMSVHSASRPPMAPSWPCVVMSGHECFSAADGALVAMSGDEWP